MNILIVDDRMENNYLLETLLKGKGYRVASAANGAEAFEQLAKMNFDLIITDILMPVMDGFQLCRKVKTDPKMQSIPLIFYTATYTGKQDEEFALKIGADRFVVKPCEPELMLQIIEEVLAEDGKKQKIALPDLAEEEVYKLYNERLIRKLEQKVEQVETEMKARLAAEKAIRESEDRFNELFKNIGSCVAVYRAVEDGNDFEFIDFNKAAEKAEKIGKDDLLGQKVTEVFPGVGDFGLLAVFQRVWKTGNPERLPISHYQDDRIIGWRDNYVYKLPSGEIVALYNDVTERKQAEEELKKQYTLLQIAAETARFGGWDVDLEKNICTWSDAVADIHEVPHGYAPPVQEGINFYAPEWREKIMEVFTNCAQKGIPYDEEMEIITAKGKRVWVRTIGRAVKDEKGKISKVHGSFQDISEQKKAEEAQSISELRYRRLFESAKDGILIIDAETGMIMDANPFLIEMLGYSQQEFLGKKVWELGFLKDLISNQENFMELQQKEYIRYEDMALEDRTGNRHEVEFISNVYPVNHHKVIQCNIRDIGERIRAEKKLREIKENLEIQVAEKTKELKERISELERFHDATINREFRIKELRDEIERLKEKRDSS